MATQTLSLPSIINNLLVDDRSQPLPETEVSFKLAASLKEESKYDCEIEGKLPTGLEGALFRNGPGLFERDGERKRCILDGDGMIQAFTFNGDGVSYQNRYVQTKRYIKEEKAGKFLYPSWTTLAPGGFWNSIGAPRETQAGVHVWPRRDKLYAFSEYAKPYVLDRDSLATIGESDLNHKAAKYTAHHKVDGVNGDWLLFGVDIGRYSTLYITALDKNDRVKTKHNIKLDKHYYMHDFFATENHLVFHLMPAIINPWGILFGTRTVTSSMEWHPEWGSKLMVVNRHNPSEKPITLETEANWMWHSLNAFEKDGQIVCDYVGYSDPDHFLSEDAALFTVMQGELKFDHTPGRILRDRIDLKARRVHREQIGEGDFEFPIANPNVMTREHRYGYYTANPAEGFGQTGLSRVDYQTGEVKTYSFGKTRHCGEAVFAPKPGGKEADGWLLSVVYDDDKKKSHLAVLDAAHIEDGPVANAKLRHHSPLSFHGNWQSQNDQ